jgi:putative inorganic carbon (HCO3(-)) transporter
LLVLPALWFTAWLAGRPLLPRTPLNAPLLVLSIMVLISLGATFDIAFSLTHITSVLLGIAAYFAVARQVRTPTNLWRAVLLFTLAGGGLALLGFAGIKWLDKVPLISRMTDQLPAFIRGLPGAEQGFSANGVAGALLFIFPLQVALLGLAILGRLRPSLAGPLAGRPWLRAVNGSPGWIATQALLLALTGGLLLLTQSRSAWAAALVGLSLLLGVSGRMGRRLLAAAGVAAVAVGLAAILLPVTRAALVTAVFRLGDELGVRRELWLRALYVIRDFPLTGLGLNTFRTVVPLLYPLYRTSAGFDVTHAHNQVLQAAVDLGLPGLAAYLGLWGGAAYVLVVAHRSTTDPWLRTVAAGLGASLAAEFIYGFMDAIALGTKLGIFFWLTLGLAVGLYQVSGALPRPVAIDEPAR